LFYKVQDQVGQIYTVINIIKIKELASHFAKCGLTDRSVAIQILTLLMWQNFNAKRGTKQTKNGRYGNPHRFVRPGPELCDSEQFKQ
jgi:hypothetical protein